MLKGIPNILSPELLKVLDEMGHTDEITIADGNFPGHSFGKPVNRTISEKEAEPQPAPQQSVKKKEFKAKKSTTNNVPASIDTSVIIDFGCFEKNPTPLNQLPAQQIVWVRTNPFASTDIKQACDALAKNSEELQKLYKLKKITI